MSSWRIRVVLSLLCYIAAAASAEPSCDGVTEFGSCNGDTGGFCPKGIECTCKGGHAFCNCPNYRGPNADYWYMGEKCDQLWSTWDLVIMAVFPGVALSFVVAVIAQWIHYCKTTAKIKTQQERKSKSERQTTETHLNQTFQSEEPGHNSRYPDVQLFNVPLQSLQSAAWNPPQTSNYYQDAGHKQPQSAGRPLYGIPDQDYDSNPHPPKKLPRYGNPSIPQADYGQSAPNGPNAPNAPFSFRRPQVVYDY